MKHTLQLEVDIDDHTKLPGGSSVWDRVVEVILDGSQEYLAYQFGSAVQVRKQPPAPVDRQGHR